MNISLALITEMAHGLTCTNIFIAIIDFLYHALITEHAYMNISLALITEMAHGLTCTNNYLYSCNWHKFNVCPLYVSPDTASMQPIVAIYFIHPSLVCVQL